MCVIVQSLFCTLSIYIYTMCMFVCVGYEEPFLEGAFFKNRFRGFFKSGQVFMMNPHDNSHVKNFSFDRAFWSLGENSRDLKSCFQRKTMARDTEAGDPPHPTQPPQKKKKSQRFIRFYVGPPQQENIRFVFFCWSRSVKPSDPHFDSQDGLLGVLFMLFSGVFYGFLFFKECSRVFKCFQCFFCVFFYGILILGLTKWIFWRLCISYSFGNNSKMYWLLPFLGDVFIFPLTFARVPLSQNPRTEEFKNH